MGSFCGDADGVLRIPATSPSRRDYQLRSCSVKESDQYLDQLYASSRPQSPWLPRSELPCSRDEVSAFRRYETDPPALDRSSYYSGPLPGAGTQQGLDRANYFSGPLPCPSQGLDRSYFSGPLLGPSSFASSPPFSGPLPGITTTTTESFEFPTGARSFHRCELSESSLPGTPEVGSSREGSLRDGKEGASAAEDGVVLREPCASYLSNAWENCARKDSTARSIGGRASGGRNSRNCVSGELGISYELAQQKFHLARGYKSGEIVCVDGASPRSEARKGNGDANVVEGVVARKLKHRPSESIAWEALNDAKNESSNCDSAMVAIPFKWEEAPGKARDASRKFNHSHSSSSSSPSQVRVSTSTATAVANGDFSFGSSHRFYGGGSEAKAADSGRWSEELVGTSDINLVAPAAARFLEPTSTPSQNPTPQKVVRSAVPFIWEEVPGKPKIHEDKVSSAAPALQLPPRLASRSIKGSLPSSRSCSLSTRDYTTPTNRSHSAPVSTLFPIRSHALEQAQPQAKSSSQPSPQHVNSRHTTATISLSGPLENASRPSTDFSTSKRGSSAGFHSGPISHFGLPQYQSAEFFCDASDAWNRLNSARSPTSTLCGPGSDGRSNPSYSCSEKSSRKSPASVTHSTSQSGTSAESFEHWSYADHVSPTSRHPSITRDFDSQGSASSQAGSIKGGEESNGAMGKLRRRLNSKSSKAKPPMSPMNGYSSHGEDQFFDCQGSGSSPALPSPKRESEAELPQPQTRLPYKMPPPLPPPAALDTVAGPECSPTVPEFSNCLALPRFLSRGESGSNTTPCFWVENPSWESPKSYLEDGYRSPAYKATLELLSPSENLMSKRSGSRRSRSVKVRSTSSQSRPLVEVLCRSLKHSFLRCTKRSVQRTQSIVAYDDQFTKRHQSFML